MGPRGARGFDRVYHARLLLGLEEPVGEPSSWGKLCAKGGAVARGRPAFGFDHSGCMAVLALNPKFTPK
jgi:hypothetical protein